MITYELLKEPAGPVWDLNNDRWEKRGEDQWVEAVNSRYTTSTSWSDLLNLYGPVTNRPRIKVGDTITLGEFRGLPVGSVARSANNHPISYVRARGRDIGLFVYQTGDKKPIDWLDGFENHELIVLYIGGDDS